MVLYIVHYVKPKLINHKAENKIKPKQRDIHVRSFMGVAILYIVVWVVAFTVLSPFASGSVLEIPGRVRIRVFAQRIFVWTSLRSSFAVLGRVVVVARALVLAPCA